MQDKEQKEDIVFVFKGISGFKNLDYISCWFLKGALYISGKSAEFAFVSTNSICQGQQVSLLWPYLLKMNLEIRFAYTSFKWSNSARANAGVSCAIIGVRNKTSKSTAKKIFSNGISHTVENISPYLISGKNIFATKRSRPISNIKEMENGSKAADGGNLIFQTEEEKKSFLSKYPEAECYIKELAGSKEFIKGTKRWCLWINDTESAEAMKIPGIRERVGAVKKFRLNSRKAATRKFANSPYRFAEIRYKATSALLIPAVSSERREYIPIGFLDPKVVVVAPNFAIFDCPPLLFSILSSKMHMVWVRAVAGRLKTDYRYSSALCYNTLPLPELTEKQKETITAHTYNILEEREANPKKTMAELYDPKKMPEGLRKAHDFLDEAVERCYRSKPFANDDERLEHLFKLYEEMTKRNKAEA